MEKYDVSIFIITADNDYINPEEYDSISDGDGVFVCITNDQLNPEYGNNNQVCIYKDWKRTLMRTLQKYPIPCGSLPWMNTNADNVLIPNNDNYRSNDDDYAANDEGVFTKYLDGYESCQNIMSNVTPLLDGFTKEEYIPAIMMAYHSSVEFNSHQVHGFLPAIGQLFYINKHIDRINKALQTIGAHIIVLRERSERNNLNYTYWWSSTEFDEKKVSVLCYMNMIYILDRYDKKRKGNILPLYNIV